MRCTKIILVKFLCCGLDKPCGRHPKGICGALHLDTQPIPKDKADKTIDDEMNPLSILGHEFDIKCA